MVEGNNALAGSVSSPQIFFNMELFKHTSPSISERIPILFFAIFNRTGLAAVE
jgi:hypothetical protein